MISLEQASTYDTFDRWVYLYVFSDGAYYVGLTTKNRLKSRHKEHKTTKKSAVFKYSIESGLPIPDRVLIGGNLSKQMAQALEDFAVRSLRKYFGRCLNSGKTGIGIGSLGGNPKLKWTYEATVEESKKYKTRRQFKLGCNSAYKAASRNNWINDFYWLVPIQNVRKTSCRDASKKYKYIKEFRQQDPNLYWQAKRNGWIKDYTWLIDDEGFLYDKCKTEALKYSTTAEFRNNNHFLFTISKNEGWLKDFTWIKANTIRWTKESCMAEFSKYNNLSGVLKHNPKAYDAAKRHKWINEFKLMFLNDHNLN